MGQSEQTLTRDGMTRQEYEQKTADGTLTVADVLRNKEHATPEQLEICTGFGRALSERMRVERDTTRLISELVRVTRERCKELAKRVADLIDESGEQSEPLAVMLDTLNKLLEGFDRFDAETSDIKACNTDCLAYARGTCGYINAATISQPAEAYNLKDKRTCPRYREIYPERV